IKKGDVRTWYEIKKDDMKAVFQEVDIQSLLYLRHELVLPGVGGEAS
ncbi:hypothetical protein Tco_1115614, partial [Tanacetum coccineum]